MQKFKYIGMLAVSMLAMVTILCSCREDSDIVPEQPVQTVTAQLNFSMPTTIASPTRMVADVVQEGGNFRGIKDIYLFCFDQYPTATTTKLGSELTLPSTNDTIVSASLSIPVGTSFFSFYARANDNPQTHADRMHYGTLEVSGLNRSSYTSNANMRFRPVPICTATDVLGGSTRGHALMNLLNDIMTTTVADAAPNDRISTTENGVLNGIYQTLTEFHTLSSQNVEIMLGYINKMVRQDNHTIGAMLADAVAAKIIAACATPPASTDQVITLRSDLQGFPADIHLPNGAARIQWNATTQLFEVPTTHDYGKGMDYLTVNDYVYPANLQYHVISDIVATDSLVLEEKIANREKYDSWTKVLDSAYVDATQVVQLSTRSIAMVQQAQYGVGRLSVRARISHDEAYDAVGKSVDVSAGFTLKGIIVCGQHEADFQFKPVAGSHEYAIYDTDLNPGTTSVVRRSFSNTDPMNYILGLETIADQSVFIALELVNNGPDFVGADGIIYHGTTFYLVASMVPSEGENYSTVLNQIFSRDRNTTVSLTIMPGWPDKDGDGIPDPDLDEHNQPKPICGLATATYGMPRLDAPQEVGLSVNLSWQEGIIFQEIPL